MYNGHGDVTALINSSGTILSTYYYDDFGNIITSNEQWSEPALYGDFDGNGDVDSTDIYLFSQYLAKSISLPWEYAFECGDVDGSSSLTSVDSIRIYQAVNGATNMFSADTNSDGYVNDNVVYAYST